MQYELYHQFEFGELDYSGSIIIIVVNMYVIIYDVQKYNGYFSRFIIYCFCYILGGIITKCDRTLGEYCPASK